MIVEKVLLAKEIKALANLLEAKYQHKFSFKNHCYLRIAYDNTVHEKWINKVNKPFINNASVDMLLLAKNLLHKYTIDIDALKIDNEKSLVYRKTKSKKNELKKNLLF